MTTKELRKYKPCQFLKGPRHKIAGMKTITALFALAQLALISGPVAAQEMSPRFDAHRSVSIQSWVEEWDEAQGRWVKVADDGLVSVDLPTVITTMSSGQVVSEAHSETRGASRYAQPIPVSAPSAMLGQYGPFVVASPGVAMMVGPTNARSPHDFDTMLRDFPGIAKLNMVEAPGTNNDIANLALGRKIREAGISTHVPQDGSVRSGAVELFLAGETRSIEDGAEFAVHSWLDNHGREADDFAPDHPAHRLYLDYYVEMGMSEVQARRFYAMTNSVPHSHALWLEADDMRGWIAPQELSPRQLSQERFAVHNVEAACTFCERVQANLEQTRTLLAKLPLKSAWVPFALNKAQPEIGYGDLTQVKVAMTDTSLLDS